MRRCLDENSRAGQRHSRADPRSFDLLDGLLDQQAYRLSYWRVAADEINYRRFFDINELAALSMEREDVFAAAHALVFRLLRRGQDDGLRIDHPDGLYDPGAVLRRLQRRYFLDVRPPCLRSRCRARRPEWKRRRRAAPASRSPQTLDSADNGLLRPAAVRRRREDPGRQRAAAR